MGGIIEQTGGHPDMDYAEHERTYRLFINLFKYGTIACVAVVAFLFAYAF